MAGGEGEEIQMKIMTIPSKSVVHGKIITTYIYRDGETPEQLYTKLGEMIKDKNLVGVTFMENYASFDEKASVYDYKVCNNCDKQRDVRTFEQDKCIVCRGEYPEYKSKKGSKWE